MNEWAIDRITRTLQTNGHSIVCNTQSDSLYLHCPAADVCDVRYSNKSNGTAVTAQIIIIMAFFGFNRDNHVQVLLSDCVTDENDKAIRCPIIFIPNVNQNVHSHWRDSLHSRHSNEQYLNAIRFFFLSRLYQLLLISFHANVRRVDLLLNICEKETSRKTKHVRCTWHYSSRNLQWIFFLNFIWNLFIYDFFFEFWFLRGFGHSHESS